MIFGIGFRLTKHGSRSPLDQTWGLVLSALLECGYLQGT